MSSWSSFVETPPSLIMSSHLQDNIETDQDPENLEFSHSDITRQFYPEFGLNIKLKNRDFEVKSLLGKGEFETRSVSFTDVPVQLSIDAIREIFKDYNDIKEIAIIENGFIIDFYDIRESTRLRCDYHMAVFNDIPVTVVFAPAKLCEDRARPLNNGTLVIFNLPEGYDNQRLQNRFSDYGDIKQIRSTPSKKTQRFIEFYDTRAAEAALLKMNGKTLLANKITIEFSVPGGSRKSQSVERRH